MNVTLAATGDIVTTDFHGLQGPQKGTASINRGGAGGMGGAGGLIGTASTLAIMVASYSFTGTLDASGNTATGTMTNLTTGETTPGTATRS